ncbi:tyrosine-protein kinase Wzc [Serratia fonticola]
MSKKSNITNNELDVNDPIDIGRMIGIILDYKWLIIAITSSFTCAAVLYIILSTPIYRADALIQVEQNVGNSILTNISDMLPSSQPASAAEIEIIKSRRVIEKTVKDLHLDIQVSERHFPVIGKGLSRLVNREGSEVAVSDFIVPDEYLGEKFKLNFENEKNYTLELNGNKILTGQVGIKESKDGVSILISDARLENKKTAVFLLSRQPPLSVANNILENLSVADKGKDTGVLALSLVGEDRVLIRKILNSISNNYLEQNVERKSEEAGKSLEFLKEQLPIIRAELDSTEGKLNQFRRENESVDLSLEAKSVLDTMVSVESQLNELTFKEAEISKLYTKEHPAYRALMEKRKTLETEKEKLAKRVSGMPKTQQEILRLTRDVQAGQEVYMQLMNKQQELSIKKASTVGNVRIIDGAETQLKSVKPKKAIIIAVSFIFGIVVSLFIIFIRSLLHKGIESPEQIEEIGIPVYSTIPLSQWQKKKDKEMLSRLKFKQNTRSVSLLALENPADLAVEAIRSLRTSLHFAMLEAKNNILMISGASPEIGKSFVSANLAAVIAQAGQKVLIIDGDMRKGYAHELFGVSSEKGLSDILTSLVSIEEAIQETAIPTLNFVSRGSIPPNPSELLMHNRFSEFVTWACENYDMVIIDTPPILAVTDAAIIGRHCGTSLLVARFDVNTLKEIVVSHQRFEHNGINIKGVILNAMVRKAASEYTYGYYQYEYETKDK